MKTFTKRFALTSALLFVALLCLGIVYIDNVKHYWVQQGGFVRLFVNTNSILNIDTNTLSVEFNFTNSGYGYYIQGRQPATNLTGNGTSAQNSGGMHVETAVGGGTFDPTTATGGAGGGLDLYLGAGGRAPLATTNATGGVGGHFTVLAGSGGSINGGAATNAATGGNGGNVVINSGGGGGSTTAATNSVGGNGGNYTMTAGAGTGPTAGWTRKSGNGGAFAMSGGSSGTAVRTNSGNGGSFTMTAGNAGAVSTAPGNVGLPGGFTMTAGNSGSAAAGGNPSPGGDINLTGGNGSTGDTNSNGGRVHLMGGSPGSGAVPGEVVVGRNAAGTARGGLQVGPLVAGTTATLTNLLSVTAVLDFPSIVAGAVADLNVAFAGAADGDVVTLGVPLSAVTNCMWMAFASNAVVYVRAANGQLVTAQDPNSGTFRITLEKYR